MYCKYRFTTKEHFNSTVHKPEFQCTGNVFSSLFKLDSLQITFFYLPTTVRVF